VTPAEGGALGQLEAVLGAAGFRCERVTFSEPGTPDVENLYAVIGAGRPCLVFAGHTDVVPPGDEAAWRVPPFSGALRDGMVWGRGAEDMKGGIACFAAAAIDHVRRNGPPKGSLAFLISGDEEGPAVNGTPKLLAWAAARGARFDHCILGEPTSAAEPGDSLKVGRRGSLTGTLTVTGRQGHVAYPHLADNPIRPLLAMLSALAALKLDEGTAHFDPSNLEIVSVDVGNPASNVIPGEARARFNIRFNDRHSRASLQNLLSETLARAAPGAHHRLDIEPGGSEAFLTEPGPFIDLLAAAIEAETGRRPARSTSGGTSDARFIKDYCPVVELGLVGRTMHQADERVPVADLVTLTAIYGRILDAYFSALA
jgi:succinyl-diaminopimelate desuccinylase